MIAFPVAPVPPPPKKETFGGPHRIGPTPQVSENKSEKSNPLRALPTELAIAVASPTADVT